ncbi:hypothetical protein [Streptomyces sp. NPDC059076]|uniref:hypothetical protein n=1 Tax=unclassified Streptomyces TaxID=2593676 RepID=UPI00369461C0
MNDIKDLLERAAAGAGRCAVTSEDVHVRAAHIRSRRMAVASGALVAVLVLATFVGPVFDAWREPQHSFAAGRKLPAAAFPAPINEIQRLKALTLMLPKRLGQGGLLRQTDSLYDRRHQTPEDVIGPFDGRVLIPSGYLYIEVFHEDDLVKSDRMREMVSQGPCESAATGPCEVEEVPGSGDLGIWSERREPFMAWRGFHGGYSGVLKLKDGSVLTITEGISDKAELASLTRFEFRELMLRVEFLPEER